MVLGRCEPRIPGDVQEFPQVLHADALGAELQGDAQPVLGGPDGNELGVRYGVSSGA